MRFPKQKKDAFSITFYIVLSFVLFSSFVTIPIMLWIFGHNINKTEFLKQDFFCTIKIYCGVALFVAIVFLWFSYRVIKKTYLTSDSFTKTVDTQIDTKLAKTATQNIIKEGLYNMFRQLLTESTQKTIEDFFDQKKKETTDSLDSMTNNKISEMTKIKDEAQRILDEIRLLQQQQSASTTTASSTTP